MLYNNKSEQVRIKKINMVRFIWSAVPQVFKDPANNLVSKKYLCLCCKQVDNYTGIFALQYLVAGIYYF